MAHPRSQEKLVEERKRLSDDEVAELIQRIHEEEVRFAGCFPTTGTYMSVVNSACSRTLGWGLGLAIRISPIFSSVRTKPGPDHDAPVDLHAESARGPARKRRSDRELQGPMLVSVGQLTEDE